MFTKQQLQNWYKMHEILIRMNFKQEGKYYNKSFKYCNKP